MIRVTANFRRWKHFLHPTLGCTSCCIFWQRQLFTAPPNIDHDRQALQRQNSLRSRPKRGIILPNYVIGAEMLLLEACSPWQALIQDSRVQHLTFPIPGNSHPPSSFKDRLANLHRLFSREANIGQLLYLLPSFLLAQSCPTDEQGDLGLSSARAICCILTNTHDFAVATIGWPALRAAAEVLTDEMEKNIVAVLLTDIQEQSAWRVDDDLAQKQRRRVPTTRISGARGTHYVQALYDYSSGAARDLEFHEGDIIQVLTHLGSGWCHGVIGHRRGWFPGSYCKNFDDATPERSDDPAAREAAKEVEIFSPVLTPFGAPKDKSNKRRRIWVDSGYIATRTSLDSRLGISLLGSQRFPPVERSKCPYCSTELTRHQDLVRHLLIHNQEKPYHCETCDAQFQRLHDLKRHTRLHTGGGSHMCLMCLRVFNGKDALMQHRKEQDWCAGRRSSIKSLEDDETDGERDFQSLNQALSVLDEHGQDLKDSGA